MMGSQGSLFDGDERPIWHAVAISLQASEDSATAASEAQVRTQEVATSLQSTDKTMEDLKAWVETEFITVATGFKKVFTGPTCLMNRVASLASAILPTMMPAFGGTDPEDLAKTAFLWEEVAGLTEKINALLFWETTANRETAADVGNSLHKRLSELEKQARHWVIILHRGKDLHLHGGHSQLDSRTERTQKHWALH